ncbi:MAG: DUF368 domain-containing protein [Thermotogota bacterium]
MKTIKNFLLGLIMGLSNLVPGVSAGTIAIISGKYDDIINSASDLFSFKFSKKIFILLLPIFIGILIAIIAFSNVIVLIMKNYEIELMNTFVGLILGGLFLIFKEINIKKTSNIMSFIISFISFILIFFFLPAEGSDNTNFINLFLGGSIGAAAMVLPGISGSSMLLIMGIYTPVLEAIGDLNFSILLPVAMGVVFGIIFIIKLLNLLLKKYYQVIMSILLALTLSGGIKILPLTSNYFSYIFIFIGLLLGILLEKFFSTER